MKIACVLGPKFEDSEFKEPHDAFRDAGHEVTPEADAAALDWFVRWLKPQRS